MKTSILHIALVLIGSSILVARCKQTYDPPAVKNPNQFLVIDGYINTAANGVTTINLNRTKALTDSTATGIPELKAKLTIQASNGATYPLTDPAGTGLYTSLPLNLDLTQRYTLQIITADGRKYASDPVTGKRTPPIDSIYWTQPGDLNLYVNTHDPSGNSKYYRFDYLETWEHDSEQQSPYGVSNGMIYLIDSANQHDRCWTTRISTNVLLANSSALSQDLVNGFQLATIPNADVRLNIRYSALVREYALTEDAYNYWQIVQKTSDNTGTLFDLQPSQLISNIHCTSNPSEPVIGFLSATSAQQQRIFIDHHDLAGWPVTDAITGCAPPVDIPQNPINPLIFDYPDTSFGPWYFSTNGPLHLLRNKCLNCTYQGGTSIKPSFWQ
jgi:hypothetical protein